MFHSQYIYFLRHFLFFIVCLYSAIICYFLYISPLLTIFKISTFLVHLLFLIRLFLLLLTFIIILTRTFFFYSFLLGCIVLMLPVMLLWNMEHSCKLLSSNNSDWTGCSVMTQTAKEVNGFDTSLSHCHACIRIQW